MKFGKLLKRYQQRYDGRFLAYKELKKAIKIQTRTGDAELFDSIIRNELRAVESYFRAQEKEILTAFKLNIILGRNGRAKSHRATESTPLLKKAPKEKTSGPRAFLAELEAIEDRGTELMKYVILNFTGFEKILKKNTKETNSDAMREKWFPRVNSAYFFTSTAIDDMLLHLHALRKIATHNKRAALSYSTATSSEAPSESSDDVSPASPSLPAKEPSTWAFILGTATHQLADNTNKLLVPLILLTLSSTSTTIFLTALLSLLQSLGTLPGGRMCASYSPRSVLLFLTTTRTILSILLAITFLCYGWGWMTSSMTLLAISLVCGIDWFVRGTIDTVRSIIPICYASGVAEAKKRLDAINTQFFTVFELGSLVGPLALGALLALGQPLSLTLWVVTVGLVITDVINHFIPPLQPINASPSSSTTDSSSSVSSKIEGFVISQWRGLKACTVWPVSVLFVLVLLLQTYRIRVIIPQILAVDVFANESWSAWIFCAYPAGGLIGNLIYSVTSFSAATNQALSGIGILFLAVSWVPACLPEGSPYSVTGWGGLGLVLLGGAAFSLLNQMGRTSAQSLLGFHLDEKPERGDVIAFNRFGVNIAVTILRVAIGIPFLFFSNNKDALLCISAAIGAFSLVAFLGSWMVRHVRETATAEDEQPKSREEGKSCKSATSLRRRSKENERGLLIVFEGLDGAGKSTQVTRLKSWLQSQGHVVATTGWSNPCHHEVLTRTLKRQPNLRSLMLTLVQAMDFIEMVNQDIYPSLNEGKAVIVDRYYFTGMARGAPRGLSREWLRKIFMDVAVEPDVVIYVRCAAKIAVDRVLCRAKQRGSDSPFTLSDDSMSHKVMIRKHPLEHAVERAEGEDDTNNEEEEAEEEEKELDAKKENDKSVDERNRMLEGAAISIYEAGLDVGRPELDMYENFVSFQEDVTYEYDSMMSEFGFVHVDGTLDRDQQEKHVKGAVLKILNRKLDEGTLRKPLSISAFYRDSSKDTKEFSENVTGTEGLHWFYRSMVVRMREQLPLLWDAGGGAEPTYGALADCPKVLLHGNPHVNNLSKTESGVSMSDFDWSCVGPYVWDIIRLLASVEMRREGQDVNIRFLRNGVLERFKEGYERGITKQEFIQVQGTAMWTSKTKRERRAKVLEDEKEEEGVVMDSNRIEEFWQKRVKEMKETEVPVEKWHHELMQAYLKEIKEENLLKEYRISGAGESQNWNGRRRILIMMNPIQPSEDKHDLLFDFKPVFTEYGPSELFANPWEPSNGKRMLKASELYAPGFGRREGIVAWEGIELAGREIPRWKISVKRMLTEEDQREICYCVGTQLGRGHVLSIQGGVSAARLLFHFNMAWPHIVTVSNIFKDQITGAYYSYLTELTNNNP